MDSKTAPAADSRLAAARRLVEHLAQHVTADIAVRLWDGSVIPLDPNGAGDLILAVRAPSAISRMIWAPRIKTLLDLVAAGDFEIEGGTLLDLSDRLGAVSTKGLAKKLDRKLLLKTVPSFLFGSKGAPRTQTAYQGSAAATPEAGRDDKALVQFHYDLSNDFYALFLDPEMQYSCAYFPTWEATLAEAQKAKLDMICRKLRLKPGERFLEIGCGWGGLLCHAAQHYGVKAHGVTLSQAQFDFAQAKVKRLGLGDRITIELKDYRALTGEFDKIASIGMYEHVGLDNRDAYFGQMAALLRPRGIYLHHAITRPMKRTEAEFRKKNPEYAALTEYIFPGGELDHIGGSLQAMERCHFEVHDVEAWREHYARTTRLWCERLYANREAAEALVGAPKTRIWLIYLAGVSLAFERGTVGICQTVATKRARGASGLAPTRAELYA